MSLYQQYQGDNHHELVCHRIQKRTKGGHLPQATGQVAVKPVSDRGDGENTGGYKQVILEWQVEDDHQHGDQHDPHDGERIGYIDEQVA